jgi:hypothetical protein
VAAPGAAPGGRVDPARDATTVRRALVAGAAVWGLVALGLLVAAVVQGGGGRAWLTGVMIGLVLGSAASAGWLLLAAALDVLAGERPGRRRLVWTFGLAAFTFLSPALVLGAQGVAS